ncbi:hypothetical protein WG901_02910 [Novosphingobium sp. PS1R-30]|uniref:Uncharacterized protein n=1 Tax=Novosphingobium anseongense TaxID=3133436 RepID=A0ABU8RRF2_9SPHN|nr:MAG: hypothetical protein EOO76_03170 [Novosphingobium sp.]
MRKAFAQIVGIATLLAAATPHVAYAQNIDFGDDSGKFAKDGECDDMRFSGPGMTDTTLIDSDIRHDASDCRSAYNQGRLTYQGGRRSGATPVAATSDADRIQWGDDAGKYAKDGECDDKRFQGAGMTSTPLLDSDIKHDATDCRTAFRQGRLQLRQ